MATLERLALHPAGTDAELPLAALMLFNIPDRPIPAPSSMALLPRTLLRAKSPLRMFRSNHLPSTTEASHTVVPRCSLLGSCIHMHGRVKGWPNGLGSYYGKRMRTGAAGHPHLDEAKRGAEHLLLHGP